MREEEPRTPSRGAIATGLRQDAKGNLHPEFIPGRRHEVLSEKFGRAEAKKEMCRSIKTLFNYDPPVTQEDVRAASLQFVRKISGFHDPSGLNKGAFDEAVDDIARISERLLASLVSAGEPRNRQRERERAKARAARRFGGGSVNSPSRR